MTQIRPEQMETMAQAVRAEFHQELKAFLREELPEETAAMNDTSLLARIAESEQRAAVYRITSQAGIAQFTCLTFLGGPRFDEHPDVHAYLVDETAELDPEERLDLLIEEIAAQNE